MRNGVGLAMKYKRSSAWSAGMPQHEIERQKLDYVTRNVIHVSAVQKLSTTYGNRAGIRKAARKHGNGTDSVVWRISAWLLSQLCSGIATRTSEAMHAQSHHDATGSMRTDDVTLPTKMRKCIIDKQHYDSEPNGKRRMSAALGPMQDCPLPLLRHAGVGSCWANAVTRIAPVQTCISLVVRTRWKCGSPLCTTDAWESANSRSEVLQCEQSVQRAAREKRSGPTPNE